MAAAAANGTAATATAKGEDAATGTGAIATASVAPGTDPMATGPRYRDWRHVRHGYYFDRGYALIVGGFWGANYYWWGYDGWRRPYRPWRVGYILPYDLYWEPIPYDLYYMLPPAPYGCRYVLVDRDVLLIVISTGLILDALMYY
jgi:hypothetical protein